MGDIDGYFIAKEAQRHIEEEEKSPADQLSERFKRLPITDFPIHGLIKEIREKLNMPLAYIADELGSHKQAVAKYEKSEVNKTITLATLDSIAKVFGLRLVYTFVPDKNTMLEFVRMEIKKELSKPEYTYLFKGVHASKYEERRERLVSAYLKNIPKSFWKSSKKNKIDGN